MNMVSAQVRGIDTDNFLYFFVISVEFVSDALGYAHSLITAIGSTLCGDVGSKITLVSRMAHGLHGFVESLSQTDKTDTATLAISTHGRNANRAKLRDAPRCCPRRHRRSGFSQQLTGFMVAFTLKCIAVDIFGNVFSDVASGPALVQVLALKAIFSGSALVTVFFQRIAAHDVDNLLALPALTKKHHVPVWRTVMVRLNHPHSVDA